MEVQLEARKKRDAHDRMQDAKDDYHRHEQRIKALKERREEMTNQAESKTDALDQVLQGMAEQGSNVYVGHGSVTDLANKWFGGDEKDALNALKERSNEVDYNFAENRFEEPGAYNASSAAVLKSVQGDADD